MAAGPLAGVTVLELGGIGPGPFAAMLMADLGANVIRIDRPKDAGRIFPGPPSSELLNRNKRSIALDLKRPESIAVVHALAQRADIVVEGYRPGVTERLGIGPDDLLGVNSRLVYCRMTGWGQTGPLAQRAGHDINYIAITGVLHAIGQADGPPQIPLNLVGDFGAGGTYLVIGALAALQEVHRTGVGQVVDAAIVDGTLHLLTAIHALLGVGAWTDERGANMLDGGAPYYQVYETSDRRHMAVGAIEPQFYAELIELLEVGLDPAEQNDPRTWKQTREVLAARFATQDQAYWTELFASSDACVVPVLSLREAAGHPQITERVSLVERFGTMQAAPAPRFSRTPGELQRPAPAPGDHTHEVLAELGISVESLHGAAIPAANTSTTTIFERLS
jgi:alpha-methylacyl-CoA racemase